MKKLAAVLLAGVMCLSLAACGSDSADEAATSDAEAAVEETTEDAEAAEDAAAEDTEGAEADAAAGEVTTATEGVLTMGTNAAFPPYEYDGRRRDRRNRSRRSPRRSLRSWA